MKLISGFQEANGNSVKIRKISLFLCALSKIFASFAVSVCPPASNIPSLFKKEAVKANVACYF
jgi:hypothetical protein